MVSRRRAAHLPLAAVLAAVPAARLAAEDPEGPVVPPFDRFYSGLDVEPASAGQFLIGELGCLRCHPSPGNLEGRVIPRPGPVLDGVGSRLRANYFLDFLTDPQAAEPGTLMPDLLAGVPSEERRPIVRALVHFLASLQGETAAVAGEPSPERGRDLFHRIGCVACHAPDPERGPGATGEAPPAAAIETPSVPLLDLDSKYTFEGLVAFLRDPLAFRPAGRMPDFALAPDEARDLAAWLAGERSRRPDTFRVDAALAEEGARHFAALGCAACHRATWRGAPVRSELPALPLAELVATSEVGCLAESPPARVPRYGLGRLQRLALRLAVGSVELAEPLSASGQLERTMMALGCHACHERDEYGGLEAGRAAYFASSAPLLGASSDLPPRLTGAGAKLREEALHEIIAGRGAARSWLPARMPGYGAERAAELARLFGESDLVAADQPPAPPAGRSARGRELVGIDGLGCITCHDFRGRRALAASGIDLAPAPRRLRLEWFRDFLRDPEKVAPGTRMPVLWPQGVEAGGDAGSGGDAAAVDDIWAYLVEAQDVPLPRGLEDGAAGELVPGARPLVVAAAIEGEPELAGGRAAAVAVGFRGGVHLAYDTAAGQLALGWKGRFLEVERPAERRTISRARILGGDALRFPQGPVVARLEGADEGTPWPRSSLVVRPDGFRLDPDGVPVFLHAAGGLEVEDRIAPLGGGGGLERAVIVRGADTAGVRLRAWAGERAVARGEGRWHFDGSDGRLECRVRPPAAARARLREEPGGGVSLVVTVEPDADSGESRIELELRW